MTENEHSVSGTVLALLFGTFLQFLIGVSTSGLNRMMVPYGYLLRFIAYVVPLYLVIGWLCRQKQMTLADCRIPRFGLSWRGPSVAALLFMAFAGALLFMQPGHWVVGDMPGAAVRERLFFLLFGSGFCSGMTEEMMFRGYLTKISEWQWGKVKGMIAPTVLFILIHYRAGVPLVVFLHQAVFLGSLSVLLSVVTYQSGRVWDAAFLHGFWNIFPARSTVFSVDAAPDPNAFFTYVLADAAAHPLMALSQMQRLLAAAALLWVVTALLLLAAKLRNRPLLGGASAV